MQSNGQIFTKAMEELYTHAVQIFSEGQGENNMHRKTLHNNTHTQVNIHYSLTASYK